MVNKHGGEGLPDPSITRKRFVKAFNDSSVRSAWTSDTQSKWTREYLSFFYFTCSDIQPLPTRAMESSWKCLIYRREHRFPLTGIMRKVPAGVKNMRKNCLKCRLPIWYPHEKKSVLFILNTVRARNRFRLPRRGSRSLWERTWVQMLVLFLYAQLFKYIPDH